MHNRIKSNGILIIFCVRERKMFAMWWWIWENVVDFRFLDWIFLQWHIYMKLLRNAIPDTVVNYDFIYAIEKKIYVLLSRHVVWVIHNMVFDRNINENAVYS